MTLTFDLSILADASVWLAWRNEIRDGKMTKVPYSGIGRKAKSDDPTTWISLEAAAELAPKIINGHGGGIGVVLGIDCGDAWQLGGIDLDTCMRGLTIENGTGYEHIEPWAKEVIDRIGSYTEISPSLTGAKIFFRYQASDLPKLRGLMRTEHGKMFKRPGKDHPPAIEFHLSNRYFAVTGDVPDGFPSTIRAVEFDELAWVVTEAGPRFIRQEQHLRDADLNWDCVQVRTDTKAVADGLVHDQSRSAVAFRKVIQLRQTGQIRNYMEMRTALMADPETSEWTHEKGLPNRERELKRLWDNTIPAAGSVADNIAEMARTFAEEAEAECEQSQDCPGRADSPQSGQATQEPIDIFGSFSPQPVLTREMLPETIANFAFDEAARMGVDPAMIAVSCLIACAAAIDDAIQIQPKAEDTEWTESARLWGAAVGEPGVMKTPSLNKAVKPLQSVEQQWRIEDAKLWKAYETAIENYKCQKAAFDKARRNGEDCAEPEEPERPPNRRCVVNEMSMEGLAERILADNPRGVLVVYNELMGLIGGFDAYKNNGVKKDRAAALELFDGGSRNRDLVRDTIWVPNWSACIVGGIQTDKLTKIAPSLGDDGLLQRFLLFEVSTVGMGEDRKPDMDAIGAYDWLVHQLAHLRWDSGPIVLSSEAQEYRQELQRIVFALKEDKSLPAAFRGHASKMHGIFARLLLTLHLIETPHRRTDLMAVVSEATAKRARDLMVKYFIPQSLNLYRRFFAADGVSDAQWIAGHVLAHKYERVSERDLYRADKKFEHDRSRLRRAIDTLVEYNWLEPIPPRRPGDKPNAWQVNSLVHRQFAERADQERCERQAEQRKAAERHKIITRTFPPK
jgi:hypothetical protein